MIFQGTADTKEIVEQRKPGVMAGLGTALSLVLLVGACAARAQDLEPRAYVDTPVGMNFLIASSAYSEGGVSTDPSLPIQGAELTQNTFVLAYARSLNVFGKSGKIDLILPFSELSGSALQAHVSYDFGRGIWAAVDGTYYLGARTTINGISENNVQENSRVGVTFALPVNKHNSIKLDVSTGLSTRTGSNFTTGGIAWQYRRGGGL